MLSKELEATLHRSLKYATELHHQYATLEHLLAALTEDRDVIPVLLACGADVDRLRREVRDYVDNELANLVADHEGDVKPTSSFQRVLQRAAIHVQSSGREDVTGANVLVAIFAERESHAVYFLQEQNITRLDAINYIVHGISKITGPSGTINTKYVVNSSTSCRNIFISYCDKDLRWISRLDVHLRPIVDAGLVTHWDDRKIKPGSKWREEIRHAIEAASSAILMISADYLASEFITQNEVPPLLKAAEERGWPNIPYNSQPVSIFEDPPR
jgi:TIR domain/Clp amino terminal domain, pathogenicity island component